VSLVEVARLSKTDRLAREAAAASDTASLLRDDDVAEAIRLAGLPAKRSDADRHEAEEESEAPAAAASGAGGCGSAGSGQHLASVQSKPEVRVVPVAAALSAVKSVTSVSQMPEDALVGALGWLDAVDLAR
jgi:phosphoribosylcarboxyaminoimidazole (NCAIR) mutase